MIHRSKPLALLAALALVTAAALLGVARNSSEPAQAAVQAVPVPAVTKLPSISGTAREGERLRADRGQWTNNPTSYAFRWQRCNTAGRSCNNISGATSSTYLLTARDVGRRIRGVVTAR